MKKSRTTHPAADNTKLDRRSFVKLLPAAGVAGLTVANSIPTSAQTGTGVSSSQPAQRVTREMMHATEQLIGIELTEAQETMALGGVNRNLSSYEALRKIDVPLDTEPATAFHPALPGKLKQLRERKGAAAKTSKARATKVEVPKFTTIEDLAFATVTSEKQGRKRVC